MQLMSSNKYLTYSKIPTSVKDLKPNKNYLKSDVNSTAPTTTYIFESLIEMLHSTGPPGKYNFKKMQYLKRGRYALKSYAHMKVYDYYWFANSNYALNNVIVPKLSLFIKTLSSSKSKHKNITSLKILKSPINELYNKLITEIKKKMSLFLKNSLSNITYVSYKNLLKKKTITDNMYIKQDLVLHLMWFLKTKISLSSNINSCSSFEYNTIYFLFRNLKRKLYLLKPLNNYELKRPLFNFSNSIFSSSKITSFFSTAQLIFFKYLTTKIIHSVFLDDSHLKNSLLTLKGSSNSKLASTFNNICYYYLLNNNNRNIPTLKILPLCTKTITLRYFGQFQSYSTIKKPNILKELKLNSTKDKKLHFLKKNSNVKLHNHLSILESNSTIPEFLNTDNFLKVQQIISHIFNFNKLTSENVLPKWSYPITKIEKLKLKNYSLIISMILKDSSSLKSKEHLSSIFEYIKKINAKFNINVKKFQWLAFRKVMVSKKKLSIITLSKLMHRRHKKRFFKRFFPFLKQTKKWKPQNLGDSEKWSSISNVVKKSFAAKINISKSKDYSFFYLIFLEQNKLLKLFRNFLIKNGLKRKANRWFISILTFIKKNYKICPIRTLRFLILRHFKASLFKERKLKKKIIYIPKKLSIKKQLFYMVFFFFKEIEKFSNENKINFKYKLTKNNKEKITHMLENYISYSIDSGIKNQDLLKLNRVLEEKMYMLKHFIKRRSNMKNSRFKWRSKYSLYKGHPTFNL